ncbi:MAG: 50S ribosomal protein L3 [Chloroflexi bacterium]|nr:50S ribosomal protein L3 [Chloroflexota bacterium]
MKGLIGKKVGMTQIFDEKGKAIPVTLIEAGPCFVTQVRTAEKDGYAAVQLGFLESKPKRISAGELGHLKRNGLPPLRHISEFRMSGEINLKAGDKVTADVFAVGDAVDVVGISKGKGFQGGMKRHHFSGGPITHGQSDRQRAPGSNAATTTPGRLFKGSRMAGHMGAARVTSQNIKVVLVDAARNLLGVAGSVPGGKNGVVVIEEARKQ